MDQHSSAKYYYGQRKITITQESLWHKGFEVFVTKDKSGGKTRKKSEKIDCAIGS